MLKYRSQSYEVYEGNILIPPGVHNSAKICYGNSNCSVSSTSSFLISYMSYMITKSILEASFSANQNKWDVCCSCAPLNTFIYSVPVQVMQQVVQQAQGRYK